MNELTEQQILYFQEWIKDLKEQIKNHKQLEKDLKEGEWTPKNMRENRGRVLRSKINRKCLNKRLKTIKERLKNN